MHPCLSLHLAKLYVCVTCLDHLHCILTNVIMTVLIWQYNICNNLLFVRLSFAISARIIKEKARVVAMDLRGHGKTSTENEIDMSIEVYSLNCSIPFFFFFFLILKSGQPIINSQVFISSHFWVGMVLQTLCSDVQTVVKAMYGDAPPAIVLVGHRFVVHLKTVLWSYILVHMAIWYLWTIMNIVEKELFTLRYINCMQYGWFRCSPCSCEENVT